MRIKIDQDKQVLSVDKRIVDIDVSWYTSTIQ